jgi:hypothetical protein
MASIAFKNVHGSTLSRVTILKDGRALEVNPPTKKTWPSMDAWVQEMPREWPRVEAWAAATASASAAAKASVASAAGVKAWTAASAAVKAAAAAAASKSPTLHVRPPLAYFLSLPEGATTSTRAAIRDALASYRAFYYYTTYVYRAKRDVKSDTPLYRVDDFLVTLTGLDPRGTYTARQILNAVLARQTRTVPAVAVASAVAAPAALEETPLVPLEEENPEIVRLTAQNAELGWNCVRLMGENKRLKTEIEALQARLCTIRAAACI